MTNLVVFSKDLNLWRNIGNSFSDILAVANNSDVLEWHVTISKFNNNKEYKFHFFILWHNGFPNTQPKISLLFGQRCMVESPRFFGNWVLLDDHLSLYSITAVLLNLRKIVRTINTDFVDVNKFNTQNCVHCNYIEQISKVNNNKLVLKNNKNESENKLNLSSSNLSVGSLTISNCTEESSNTGIIQLDKQSQDTKIVINNDINIKKDRPKPKPKLESKEMKNKLENDINKNEVPQVETNNNKNNNKVNKKSKKEKIAIRYLEINERGEFEWKWSEGKRPNEEL